MVLRSLAVTVVLASVTGVAALGVVVGSGRVVSGWPTPYCTVLRVVFDTDEEMRRVAGELRGDARVREVVEERTKAENHERLTGRLREQGREDLADATRVATTPASLRVVEAFGVDAREFAERLRARWRVNYADVCVDPEALDGE